VAPRFLKLRIAIGIVMAAALFVLIVHIEKPSKPSPAAPDEEASASVPAAMVVPVAPLPSINQSMRFWSDAEAHGRLDTNLAVKRYFFDLAMNHRILVQGPSGAALGVIVVPGDVAGLNWNSTTTQEARLTDSGVPVEITPAMLQELKKRRDTLLALGVPR
jgi:hypothetical protein